MGRIEIYSFNLVYLRLYSLFHQTTPTSEEIGYCDEIKVSEIGGTSVTIFKQGKMLWLDVIFWLKIYLELLSTCPTVFGSLSSKVSQLQSAKFPRYNLFDFYFLIFFFSAFRARGDGRFYCSYSRFNWEHHGWHWAGYWRWCEHFQSTDTGWSLCTWCWCYWNRTRKTDI